MLIKKNKIVDDHLMTWFILRLKKPIWIQSASIILALKQKKYYKIDLPFTRGKSYYNNYSTVKYTPETCNLIILFPAWYFIQCRKSRSCWTDLRPMKLLSLQKSMRKVLKSDRNVSKIV